MKPMNKIRSTHSFCITSVDAAHVVAIHQHFGRDLIAVAYDNTANVWTVRTSNLNRPGARGLFDHLVKFTYDDKVEIVETRVIHDWSLIQRGPSTREVASGTWTHSVTPVIRDPK